MSAEGSAGLAVKLVDGCDVLASWGLACVAFGCALPMSVASRSDPPRP